jgi:hypothetical protein
MNEWAVLTCVGKPNRLAAAILLGGQPPVEAGYHNVALLFEVASSTLHYSAELLGLLIDLGLWC